ncbi:MAG TPA: histidine kinase [Gemmatimonadota bacterium]|nr:histidine kinase [Gemmatimonadota bacterium]
MNDAGTSGPRRLRAVGLYAAAWTAIGLFVASQWLLYNLYDEAPEPAGHLLAVALTDWYVRGLVAVPVLFAARRVLFREGSRLRAAAFHVPASIAFALTKITICWWLGFVLPWLQPVGFLSLLLGEIHLDIAIYWILLGLVQWRESRRRLRDREREAARFALQASELETRLARAQLDSLKMQLQPHFLFNTLHSVSALIHEDDEAADLMIARLSDFLRLVIEHAGAQEVALVQELEFLNRYLEIQQVRFQDRLRVSFDVDPEVLDAMVPNLVLQPLVENAIRHAVEPRAAGGRVEVSATRNGDTLCLTVRDDGPGLRAGAWTVPGVGISNTRARLEQLYGDRQALEIANHAEGGALVTVRFPWRVGEAATAA